MRRARARAMACATAAIMAATRAVPAMTADPAPPVTPAWLGQLMTLLAQRRHAEVEFEQTQYLAALRHPLHSRGIMIYDAPSHLEQRTLEPHPQSMVLDQQQLTVQTGSRQRVLQLDEYPQVAVLIEGIRATLAGDRAALEQSFALAPHGDLDHWQLELRPRATQSPALVDEIRIAGEHDAILRVEVQQADGDHSLMTLRPRP